MSYATLDEAWDKDPMKQISQSISAEELRNSLNLTEYNNDQRQNKQPPKYYFAQSPMPQKPVQNPPYYQQQPRPQERKNRLYKPRVSESSESNTLSKKDFKKMLDEMINEKVNKAIDEKVNNSSTPTFAIKDNYVLILGIIIIILLFVIIIRL